jgi:CO/xanthine dehydrogenase FAD-binding subunit
VVDLIEVAEVIQPQREAEIPPWREGDAYVAGGTWLFSEPQPGVRRLIDLTRIPWEPLSQTDGGLRIAATCTYDELEARRDRLGTAGPLFSRAIRTLSSSFKTYGVATVGGNLCLAYAKSMMAPVCCALNARYELATPAGEVRWVPAREFQIGAMQTVRRPGEYLRAVHLPRSATRGTYALRKHSYTPTSHATAMVIAARTSEAGGNGEDPPPPASLVVSAATTLPVRVDLPVAATAADAARAAARVCEEHPMLEDGHGSAPYRRAVVRHLAERAWAAVQTDPGAEEEA